VCSRTEFIGATDSEQFVKNSLQYRTRIHWRQLAIELAEYNLSGSALTSVFAQFTVGYLLLLLLFFFLFLGQDTFSQRWLVRSCSNLDQGRNSKN